jgi:hypothetical protein
MSTASIEGLVGAAYISQPPAQMVPFPLAGGLCRPPAWIFTTGGFHCTRQHSEAENSLKLIQVTNISTCMDSNNK